eukprot:6178585-Pleurochrysis_carterae.AAC.1
MGKFQGKSGKAKRSLAYNTPDFFVCALFYGRINIEMKSQPAAYTDKAKSREEPSILMAEHELRQQSAGRTDRCLGADCLERRNGN